MHLTAKRKDADLLEDQLRGAWPAEGSPVTLIGYWEGDYEPGWPNVMDFVDEQWDQAERDRVASYLEAGFVPWIQMGISPCRMCGAANGSAEQTDGVYIWPEGLAHYVRAHGVRLPVSVIRHIHTRCAEIGASEVKTHPELVNREWWRTATLAS